MIDDKSYSTKTKKINECHQHVTLIEGFSDFSQKRKKKVVFSLVNVKINIKQTIARVHLIIITSFLNLS